MKIRFFSGLLISFLMAFSCTSLSYQNCPYTIEGTMVTEDSSRYENAGFDFSFTNRSPKEICSFTLVFFLYDEDGNPPLAAASNIVLQIDSVVDPFDSLSACVNIDRYFSVIPEQPYTVDFLYVSKICYSDGTEWTDPFGFYCM